MRIGYSCRYIEIFSLMNKVVSEHLSNHTDVSKVVARKRVKKILKILTLVVLCLLVVCLTIGIGYMYQRQVMLETQLRQTEALVTAIHPVPVEPDVDLSENLTPDILEAILGRVTFLANVTPDEKLLSANRVVSAPDGQTYQVGDYIFVFNTRILIYRAKFNQIVGIALFIENSVTNKTPNIFTSSETQPVE